MVTLPTLLLPILLSADVETVWQAEPTDQFVEHDGQRALHFKSDAVGRHVFKIHQFEPPKLDNQRLVYRGNLATKAVTGQAYLEIWCRFPGQGEFFGRALQDPRKGDTSWDPQETYFFLKSGQQPDRITMNLVLEGTGEVWLAEPHLLKGNLPMWHVNSKIGLWLGIGGGVIGLICGLVPVIIHTRRRAREKAEFVDKYAEE